MGSELVLNIVNKLNVPILTSFSGLLVVIVSVIHNDSFVNVGAVTFVYGLVSNLVDALYWYKRDMAKGTRVIFYLQVSLMVVWVLLSVWLWPQ